MRVKHGLADSRIYKTWRNMKSRCNNPKSTKYYLYGGKGIKVCKEWLGDNGFINFYNWAMANGYDDNLTIDRIDGNKDYCPVNCRWATTKEQNNNTTQNHYITFEGKRQNITQWADELGISYKVLSERIRRGWDIRRAFQTPPVKIDNFGVFIRDFKKISNRIIT